MNAMEEGKISQIFNWKFIGESWNDMFNIGVERGGDDIVVYI